MLGVSAATYWYTATTTVVKMIFLVELYIPQKEALDIQLKGEEDLHYGIVHKSASSMRARKRFPHFILYV